MQLGLILGLTLEMHILPVAYSFFMCMVHTTLAMGHGDVALFPSMLAVPMELAILMLTVIHMMFLRSLTPSTCAPAPLPGTHLPAPPTN
eukprot:6724666-Ditylum_brightwellii.AAC.1